MPGPRSIEDWVDGVRRTDRAVLGRALTLVESTKDEHRETARELLERLLPFTGGAHRVGVSGTPGVGKSSFIERLGTRLTGQGKRVAVLAIDPSSPVSGGSVLGDKTRMQALANDPSAFIRPTPSGGTLGGVARRTREAMLVLEAAGHDVIFIESVGVGQSEFALADVVDFFLLLIEPGAGDSLQGIKRGILERIDLLAIHKADGDREESAVRSLREYRSALAILRGTDAPKVLRTSAVTGEGIDEVWRIIADHRTTLEVTGDLASRRREQDIRWMWSLIEERLVAELKTRPDVADLLKDLEREVREGRMTSARAADAALDSFLGYATRKNGR